MRSAISARGSVPEPSCPGGDVTPPAYGRDVNVEREHEMRESLRSVAEGGAVTVPIAAGGVAHRPHLVVLDGGAGTADRVRLLGIVAGIVVLAVVMFTLGAMIGARTSEAAAPPEIVGTATVAPGGTLWDIAVTHAPDGTDPRAYLEELRRVNGLGSDIAPWTVVLLPAP
jgi:hypothetical protein